MKNYFGIDIGCTAVKFGEVQVGQNIETIGFDMMLIENTSREEKYTEFLLNLIQSSDKYKGVGIGFPSLVWDEGILNLEIRFDDIWKKLDHILTEKKIPHFAINDADAAGYAELYSPEGEKYRKGVTVVLTLGTGIGSGIFLNGNLLPNSELGMIEINGMWAEHYAAPSVIHKENLSTREWADRLQVVISQVETILSPDHILLGGGISSDFEKFQAFISTQRATLGPAYFRNQAGVVGAAMYAASRTGDYQW